MCCAELRTIRRARARRRGIGAVLRASAHDPVGSGCRGLSILAVAALSAAGWLIGHPLPIVMALVIAGVDVLETTFLLIVVTLRGDG